VEGASLLGQGISFGAKVFLLVKGGLHHKLHIGINGQGIRSGGVPLEFLTERLGILKGQSAIVTEVGPLVLIRFCGNGERRIVVGQELDGVIGGARVGDTDGVGDLEGGLDGSANNSGFILDHEEHDDFVGVLCFFWL